ncbi:MAG TPA: sigma-70 family RNA polymerase sigma factor [Gemmataceae bacterium]|nr:sigma-70 family RNA polymerase sigma factor [Gemmataceae bacterium]
MKETALIPLYGVDVTAKGATTVATGQLTLALQHLRQLIRQGAAGELPDTELLERFVGQRDEAAFEVLVWRHGPMVLSLCQRLLHNAHDAEDVLQATFLTLARKAGSIRKRESLGSLLYKVAYRIALHAKARAAQTATGAGRMQDLPAAEAADEDIWQEVRPLLDEAIQRLPEKYRIPIVLCYLQGKTNREAAAQIGCPIGTVCTRLARARELLRRQLARHGVTLSAALLGTVLSRHAVSAAASKPLVAVTVKAACLLAAGQTGAAGLISANVASLVQGASKAMFLTKLKITGVLLLAAGVVAAGAGVLTQHARAGRQANDHQAAAAKAPATKEAARARAEPARDDNKDAVAFGGRVLDPDGKPLAGAKIYMLYYTMPRRLAVPVRATSDKDGRFHFTIAKADFARWYSTEPWSSAFVVAQADGYGLAFDVPRRGKKPQPPTDMTLRLAKDDVPVTGRILDLEGKPLAGVRVSVRGLLAPMTGDLGPWIKALKARQDGYPVHNDFLSGFPGGWRGQDLGRLYPAVTTGADGRFRLKNLGRERVVAIGIDGPTIETRGVHVMTRAGGTMRVPEYRNNPQGGTLTCYGASFNHVAAPTQPIVGVVRDKDTGKALAGAIIESYKFAYSDMVGRSELRTVADKDGRYRLTGMPKGAGNEIRASPPEGQPYLMSVQSVPNGSGLDPVTVDFKLKRGVWIQGKVIDKATGKPVNAQVQYFVFEDNPHRTEAPGLDTDVYLANRVDDGTFRVVGLAGRGLIAARARGDRYRIGVGADRIKGLHKNGRFRTYPHACEATDFHTFVEVNPEKGAVLATCPVVLDPGRTLTGTVLGPDGEPLAGARVSGLTSYGGGYWADEPQTTAAFAVTGFGPGKRRLTAAFAVTGFGPAEHRLLMFVHEGKRLAGFLVVKADEKGPLTIKLRPWGVLQGCLVNADGQPRADAELVSLGSPIRHRTEPIAGTPDELSFGSLPTRERRTDKDGKFRLEGLIPGLKYNIGIEEEGYRITGTLPENLMVRPGEVKDLGDVKPEPTGA